METFKVISDRRSGSKYKGAGGDRDKIKRVLMPGGLGRVAGFRPRQDLSPILIFESWGAPC